METAIALRLTQRWGAQRRFWVDAGLVVGGSLFVAAMAQLAFYLPLSPVPITGQTFAVLLVGFVLGARRGGTSLALYVAQGCLGLPFFAGGGSGLAWLFGPTGGYLLGFVAAAVFVGWLAERGFDRRLLTAGLAFAAGEAVIYLLGLPWLAGYVGWERALAAGFWPFLVVDFAKAGLVGVLLPAAWAVMRAFEQR